MSVAVDHRVDGPADAPVLVLSGSLGSTLAMWDPQVPVLSRHLRVVRYDHRGHGGSPVPEGPYTLGELGGDVLALLDRLGVERAHFCGLSLGGMVGMWLAANAPDRIDRLALLCTSAALGPPSMWAERAATVRAGGTAAVAEAVVERWFTPAYRRANPERTARWRAVVAATPAEGYAGCCEAIRDMALTQDLRRISATTLVVAGADDPATPPEHAHRIAEAVEDARAVVVDAAAHLANVEQSERISALLVEHFTREAA